MSDKKVYLVQLLNIAGVGPIFGPILGALYGPVAMLWIVFGCIFAGAVHDYFSGMLSVRARAPRCRPWSVNTSAPPPSTS